MTRDDRQRKRLTRRGFIQQSGTLGAGVALGPFVLDLSACSSTPPNSENPATGASSPMAGAASGTTTAPAGAAGTFSQPAANSGMSKPSTAPAAGSGTANMPSTPAPSTSTGGAGNPAMAQASGGSGGMQSPATSTAGQPAAAGAPMTAPSGNAIAAGAVLLGLYPGDGAAAMSEAAKRLDFSWLKPGDTVLIKVAVNSQYKHPTTTSVPGVQAMIKELKMRGAKRVIVGDQAGVEHVRLTAMGRYGKTSDCWAMCGMDKVAPDGEPYYFDDHPFDTGYFSATLPMGNRWPRGMYLPTIIKEADHIIYMPRIGQHILAGNTIGHKSAIGWLRDDSRHDLHNDAKDFYEKYTEINYTDEIRSRFRMVVAVSEAILLKGGPDTGTNYELKPVMVTASTSIPNHDCIGSGVLVTLDKTVQMTSPGTMTYAAASAPQNNAFFANGAGVPTGDAGPWTSGSTQSMFTAHNFEAGVTKDRAIARGWELSGGKPMSISVVLDGAPLDASLKSGLMTHGEGLYVFS